MSNASKELSVDYNNLPIGMMNRLRDASKIFKPGDNQIHAVGKESASVELSKDTNKVAPGNGMPDKGLFEASK